MDFRVRVPCIRKYLLDFLQLKHSGWSDKRAECEVRAHYGSSTLDLAEIFFDLCNFELTPGLEMSPKEKTLKGLRKFAEVMFFLWTYPKNDRVRSSRFGGNTTMRGPELEKWILRIADLKRKKIHLPKDLNSKDGPNFVLTVDGTDFREREKQHNKYIRDDKQYSQKHDRCANKFEIGIDIWQSKVVWVNGPFRGGKADKEIFLEGLAAKIPAGKLVIADRGYGIKEGEHKQKVSLPRSTDSKELHNFKSRARARHESFNGRVKEFGVCAGQYFRHGGGKEQTRDMFGTAITAVIVILQYQMDNGAELYAV